MIANDVFQKLKPEDRELGEHFALVRYAGRENVIECRDAIGSDEDQALVIQLINVSDLAARQKRESFNFGLDDDGVQSRNPRNFSAAAGEDSSPPGDFVNEGRLRFQHMWK